MKVTEFRNKEIAFLTSNTLNTNKIQFPKRGYKLVYSNYLEKLKKTVHINNKKYNSYVTIATYSEMPLFPFEPKEHYKQFHEWAKIRDQTIKNIDFILDFDSTPTIKGLEKAWQDTQTALKLLEIILGEQTKHLTTYFSVVGCTKILVNNKDNIELITFEELFKNRTKFIDAKILSFDSGKVKFSKITDYIEHDKETIDIFYENCYSPVTMSPDHSIYVFDNETASLTTKLTKDIVKSDFLPTFITKNTNSRLDSISFDYEFVNVKRTYKIKLTNDFLRLCGYYLGDGHVESKGCNSGFSFNAQEKNFINDVDKIVQTLESENYHLNNYLKVKNLRKKGWSRKQIINELKNELTESQICNILYQKNTPKQKVFEKVSYYQTSENCTQLIFSSQKWNSFFKQNFGKGAYNKKLPSWVWKLNNEQFLELLQGYINSDGYKKGKSFMRIKSVSKKLIEQFVWLCKLNGVGASIRKEIGYPHTMPQETTFKGSITYNLDIVWQELNNNPNPKFGRQISQRLLPTKPLQKIYKDLIKIKIKQGMRQVKKHRFESSMLKKKRVNKQTILKIIKWIESWGEINFNEKHKTIIKNYKFLIKSDIGCVKIKDIKDNKIQKVYDVSVDKAENFWGGDMPVLLHNSGNKGFHILAKCKITTTAQEIINTQKALALELSLLCPTIDTTIYDTARLRKLLGSKVYSKNFGTTRVIPIQNENDFKDLIQALKNKNT